MNPCIDKTVPDIAGCPCIIVTMYIDQVPNRGSPPAILLHRAWREGKKIRKKTLDNLSKWPPEKVASRVARRTRKPMRKDEIGVRVGKHFTLNIEDGVFEWSRCDESIPREEAVDGIYVIRTSEPKEKLSAQDAVRYYNSLAQVKRAFAP
jgi:hypothetical protein